MDAHSPIRILVIDDDPSALEVMKETLSKHGNIDLAQSGHEAKNRFERHEYDIVLLDYLLPDLSGFELLLEFKENQPSTEIIMITNMGDVKTAVKCIKGGAFDYLNKNFNEEDLVSVITRAKEKLKSTKEMLYLRSEVERLTDYDFIVGYSQRMGRVMETLDRAAETSATVLLQGESGTGKELAARYLHKQSARSEKPFVAVNMASIPDNLMESTLFGHERGSFTGALRTTYGKFEIANGGTLFLDEIADLKTELQAKILRVMQEAEIERIGSSDTIPVDVRIIAATHRNLKELVMEEKFREDLFFRLNVIPITLPALRERIEDLPLLVDLFIKRYNRKFGRDLKISQEALNLLSRYPWPGNIRELENLIARLVAIHPAHTILPEDIPIEYQLLDEGPCQDLPTEQDRLKTATDSFERSFILRVLERENWHHEKTAIKLGIHRKTLEYKIKKLNLNEIIDRRRKDTS